MPVAHQARQVRLSASVRLAKKPPVAGGTGFQRFPDNWSELTEQRVEGPIGRDVDPPVMPTPRAKREQCSTTGGAVRLSCICRSRLEAGTRHAGQEADGQCLAVISFQLDVDLLKPALPTDRYRYRSRLSQLPACDLARRPQRERPSLVLGV